MGALPIYTRSPRCSRMPARERVLPTRSPFIAAAVAAALAAAVAFRAGKLRPSPAPAPSVMPSAALPKALCPRGTLPDEGVCIPVPRPEPATTEAHEAIPRRPDRDANFDRYALPVTGTPRLATPADGAPAGAPLLAVAAAANAEVRALALEGQQGDAVVVHAGTLLGSTLVLEVTAGTPRQQYLVIAGNLGGPSTAERGASAPRDQVIGRTGSAPLLFGVRLLRPGVDARSIAPSDLLADSTAVWVDPRNVLPTKGP